MATGTKTLPAPVGGLNERDSLADMSPQDAVILENWYPYPTNVGVRKGSINYVTGFPSTVETVVDYAPPSGAVKLFAAAGANIYDATTVGVVGAPVVTGNTNARWQDVAITTGGGSFIYLLNGVDKPQLYDGSTWKAIDGASTPAITGVTTSTLVQGCLFKNRIYLVEANSTRAWYLPVNSIGGAASQLDLGSVFRKGGYLMSIYSWTIDAGDGADDHLCFVSSNGEIAVYSGTDPASATTFSLVGNFAIGRPIGRRCGCKYAGDLLIMTEEGLYPLSKGLLSASIDKRVAITDKIQNGISAAVTQYKNNYGWIPLLFENLNMVILNVPAGSGMNYQYVQNTITGSWAKFTGWNATSWRNTSIGLFFGNQNSVQQAWVGNSDNTNQIVADALPSFQYFGSTAQNKYFTLVRPYLTTTGFPSIVYGLNTNFTVTDITGVFSYTPPSGMIWGSMFWGSMFWGGGQRIFTSWKTVGDIANSAALRIKVQANNSDVAWQATDFVYQRGGVF